MSTCEWTNLFGLTEYDGQCSYFGGKPALPEGLGWFIVVGLGLAFSLATSLMFFLANRYDGSSMNSESFATAGRSIKTGLIACDVVSKWTWAATLLQSSNVAYKFGVSGPFWYASGATIQVLLFAILAVEIKRKCPQVHTVLEIVRARWGTAAHIIFMFFAFATNIIVTAMLILGGAAVINALSGVDVYAAAFLIPVGVAIYTAFGGLKAAYLASWGHTTIIYIALCIFMFLVYASNETLGSPSKVYENLRKVEDKYPVDGNKEGSYLTMFSQSGIIFGIINIIGNFGTVFVDQSYWQGAIAAMPQATYKGYLLGGLCWFAIPFTMATTMGLSARAFDLPITIDESNQGLVPPAVAVHLMGKGGAFLMTLQLFMAVTSTGAAEQIAVSSLVNYDIYKTYINKNATQKQMMVVNRVMVVAYSVLSGVFAVILLRFGLSLGWVYLFMGIVIGSAVFPIACAITWKKTSKIAAITAALVSMPLAVMTWLITAAKLNNGVIDKNTTGQDYPMLAGNLVALFLSAILCTVLTFIFPDDFDWEKFKQIETVEWNPEDELTEKDLQEMDEVVSFTYKSGGVLSFVLIIVWPCLALPVGVFTQGYFTFWVILAIIWGLLATLCCAILPIWESWDVIFGCIKMVVCCQKAPQPIDASVSKGEIDLKIVANPDSKTTKA